MILYFSESGVYGFILVAGILSLFPKILPRLGFLAFRNHDIFSMLLIFIVASCVGFSGVQLQKVWTFEKIFGPLRIKEFYAPSVTGQEGMIGKTGKVIKKIGPRGIVQIGAELWSARSNNGKEIVSGENIVVRDIEGNLVIVEVRK